VAPLSTSWLPNESDAGERVNRVWMPLPSSVTDLSGALLCTVAVADFAPVVAGSNTMRTSQV
jgi:hypothetical protein